MKKRTLVTEILERVARKMGIEVHVEPRWGYVGQIVLPDGRKRYFRNTSLDINGLGSTEIARDKDYAQYFLKRMGYPVIPVKHSTSISGVGLLEVGEEARRRIGTPSASVSP
jgi:hypothetical protein